MYTCADSSDIHTRWKDMRKYVIHSFLRVRVPINAKSGIAVPLQGGRVWWHCNTWACNRGMQWDGDTHISTHASAFVLAIMALLSSYYACGCVFEQQEELCASPTEWKSNEFHSFTVCFLFCVFIVVINPLITNDAFWRHPTLTQLPGEFPIEERFFLA